MQTSLLYKRNWDSGVVKGMSLLPFIALK